MRFGLRHHYPGHRPLLVGKVTRPSLGSHRHFSPALEFRHSGCCLFVCALAVLLYLDEGTAKGNGSSVRTPPEWLPTWAGLGVTLHAGSWPSDGLCL